MTILKSQHHASDTFERSLRKFLFDNRILTPNIESDRLLHQHHPAQSCENSIAFHFCTFAWRQRSDFSFASSSSPLPRECAIRISSMRIHMSCSSDGSSMCCICPSSITTFPP